MAGGWRSLTGSHSSTAPSWPSTPLWSAQSTEMEPRDPERIRSTGSRCSTLGETKRRRTPSWWGEVGRARLVVLAGEVGGRFSAETAQFISSLAWVKTQGMSDLLRRHASTAWTRRWSALLSCAAARAFASSLLDGRASGGVDGETFHAQEVLAAARPWVKRGASFSFVY